MRIEHMTDEELLAIKERATSAIDEQGRWRAYDESRFPGDQDAIAKRIFIEHSKDDVSKLLAEIHMLKNEAKWADANKGSTQWRCLTCGAVNIRGSEQVP